MLDHIYIENDDLIIDSFRAEDLNRWSELTSDIYSILSDQRTLKYLLFKRLQTKKDASELFSRVTQRQFGPDDLAWCEFDENNGTMLQQLIP